MDISCERTTSLGERSLKDSVFENGETSSRISTSKNEKYEEASSSGIFKRRNEEDFSTRNLFRDSTSRRTFE